MAVQKAQLNYLKIAPRKVRLLADSIKGLSVNEAEAELLFRSQRPAKALLKLLRSAIVRAKNSQKIDMSRLFVQNVRVDRGPMLKRYLPRARGMATPIQKKMSHITLILGERGDVKNDRFQIVVPKKLKDKGLIKKPGSKVSGGIPEARKVEKPKEQVGFFRRIFRRKSV